MLASRKRRRKPTQPAAKAPRSGASDDALWLYGRHAVLAAAANPRRRLLRLLALADTAAEIANAAAASALDRPSVEVNERAALAALLPAAAVHQGYAALVRPLPETGLDDLLAATAGEPQATVLMLDQLTDPRNVGAVLRSAAAFAADGLIVQDRHAPPETGALAKAASGALEQVPMVRAVNLTRALKALQEAGFDCWGLDARAGMPLAAAPLTGRVTLVVGSEKSGLRRLVAETVDGRLHIPIASAMESLNVAVAAAIALYEVSRQRSTAATTDGASGGETARRPYSRQG